MKNYYKVLGISSLATNEDIRQAYKELLEQYHPDVTRGDKYAEERFIDISVAYKTLSNKAKRDDYNRILNGLLPFSAVPEPGGDQPVYPAPAVMKPEVTAAPRNNKLPVYIAASLPAIAFAAVIMSIAVKQKKIEMSHIAAAQHSTIPASLAYGNYGLPASEPVIVPALHDKNLPVAAKKVHVASHSKTVHYAAKASVTAMPVVIKKKDIKEQVIVSTLPPNYSIGSSRNEVLKIQGTPNSIIRYDNQEETWVYGNSKLHFSNGKVASFRNNDKNLLIQHF